MRSHTLLLGAALRRKWPTLLLLPFANACLVVVFWQSQVEHYRHSTEGVLLMWLVAGLVFVLIQLSLQISAWKHAASQVGTSKAYEALWILGTQIGTFGLAVVYNIVALMQLLLLGVRPTQPFDAVIAGVLAGTLVIAFYRHGWRRMATPQSRLLFATGTKATPQWLQAGWFTVSGAGGMHAVTIAAITAMGVLRYGLTRLTLRQFSDDNTVSANRAAWRDLLSILAMAAGWCIGMLAL